MLIDLFLRFVFLFLDHYWYCDEYYWWIDYFLCCNNMDGTYFQSQSLFSNKSHLFQSHFHTFYIDRFSSILLLYFSDAFEERIQYSRHHNGRQSEICQIQLRIFSIKPGILKKLFKHEKARKKPVFYLHSFEVGTSLSYPSEGAAFKSANMLAM